MEFRLIWKGSLPSSSGDGEKRTNARAQEKQILRKHFHKQLRELWNEHPDLTSLASQRFTITPSNSGDYPPSAFTAIPSNNPEDKTWLEDIADNYQRLDTRFVPLIRKDRGFTCALDILFLRRDAPGGIVSNAGDIDNRVKTLFDGLRMPENKSQLGGLPIDADENPFYCLLEDDRLITSVSVTTDRLLTPRESGEAISDVEVIIKVTIVNPSAIFTGHRML